MTNKHHFSLILSVLALTLPILAAFTPVHASSETTVYNFKGQTSDGATPQSTLSGDSAGNGYGTTYGGGSSGNGTVYKITPTGQETILHSFTGGASDGANPRSGVTLGKDGSFYGTTQYGGTANGGTVYKITGSGQETVLHSFTGGSGGSDGYFPYAKLIQGTDGSFYGTTFYGGAFGVGTVFKITAAGQMTILHSFTDTNTNHDGSFPQAGLIQAKDGSFYGTTTEGGTSIYGTVYTITSSGQETVLHSFTSTNNDGATPYAGLIQAKDGSFYGTTYYGGMGENGTVYKITSTGQETVLYTFTSANASSDGLNPVGGVIQATDGNFYGTTLFGGASNLGTVYKIIASGQEMVLHSFTNVGGDGANPYVGLIQDKTGYLYGTAEGGGTHSIGTIFRVIL